MAGHTPLPKDATLRSVASTLDDKVRFVSHAYKVLNDNMREHGPVVLQLGVSRASKGKRPNYRINDAETGERVAVMDGDTHRTWLGDEMNPAGDWSDAAMTFAEVRDFLGELREEEKNGRARR